VVVRESRWGFDPSAGNLMPVMVTGDGSGVAADSNHCPTQDRRESHMKVL